MSTGSNDWANDIDLPSAGPDDGFGTTEYGFDEGFDAGGVDASKVGSGHIKVTKTGFYHFSIKAEGKPIPYEEDDMNKKRKPSILCVCTVLKAANGQPEGALLFHDLVLGGKGGGPMIDTDRDKTLNFLVGLGILKNSGGKVIDPETGTTKIKSSTLVARINALKQFVGNVSLNPANVGADGRSYPDRYEFQFGRGAFPVTAREVAHVAKNEAALKEAGFVPAVPNKANV